MKVDCELFGQLVLDGVPTCKIINSVLSVEPDDEERMINLSIDVNDGRMKDSFIQTSLNVYQARMLIHAIEDAIIAS